MKNDNMKVEMRPLSGVKGANERGKVEDSSRKCRKKMLIASFILVGPHPYET